jgi:hypothetical protein
VDVTIDCFRLLVEWLEECHLRREEARTEEMFKEAQNEFSSHTPMQNLPPRLMTMRAWRFYAVAVGKTQESTNPGARLLTSSWVWQKCS